ncbi:MAG: MBL fold metallo-hydrolase [Anaerolineae bacterium]|nr:MBL fold metallo-hydrolase [Anaerolineae bacterium]MDK1081256.1 MBL fold metallo-hydrolase [Anaerolineae bacterium]MDK1118010.1 MBL fold metallo-hydrolase [Anaerolineae bacterium]
MHRERVTDNIYWFQSDIYAQVTAGVIAGPQWAAVIDTLALPDETLGMREFIEHDLGLPVRYVINTHYHADHSWGNCFFPGATIIAHARCRDNLIKYGVPSLESAMRKNSDLKQVKIVLPHITFNDGHMTLKVGKKNLKIMTAFGHSNDGISVLIEEDRVLFAGDSFMPIPYVVDGNVDQVVESIKQIGRMSLENIVQGHGEVILRGEIEAAVKDSLAYISAIKKAVRNASRRKDPLAFLEKVSIEDCGKSRVTLGGLAVQLHENNLLAVLEQMQEEKKV